MPSPPRPDQETGLFDLQQGYSATIAPPINDNGPNQAFKYVSSASNVTTTQIPTAGYYIISPDLENTNSAFYQAQCGDYDPLTVTGFISGAQLLANTISHEIGNINSHYKNYVVEQNDPNSNIGIVAERQIGAPTKDFTAFKGEVANILAGKALIIDSATGVEPCGGSVNHSSDQNCIFQGNGNFLRDAQGNYDPINGTYTPCR